MFTHSCSLCVFNGDISYVRTIALSSRAPARRATNKNNNSIILLSYSIDGHKTPEDTPSACYGQPKFVKGRMPGSICVGKDNGTTSIHSDNSSRSRCINWSLGTCTVILIGFHPPTLAAACSASSSMIRGLVHGSSSTQQRLVRCKISATHPHRSPLLMPLTPLVLLLRR